MNLSSKEMLELEEYIIAIRDNPLLEMIYLFNDKIKKRVYVMTFCNFWDSKNLLEENNRNKMIKNFSSVVTEFNIKNRNSRLEFHGNDISMHYDALDYDDNYLANAMVLLDKTVGNKKNIYTKKKNI